MLQIIILVIKKLYETALIYPQIASFGRQYGHVFGRMVVQNPANALIVIIVK